MLQPGMITRTCGYEPLRSQGRPHTRFIDTDTFGPFRMV